MGHYCYDTRHWVEDDLDPSQTIEGAAPESLIPETLTPDWMRDVPPAYLCAQARTTAPLQVAMPLPAPPYH